MNPIIAKKLTRDELVTLVRNVIDPIEGQFTESELNQQLLVFCMNSPDPSSAIDLVIEYPDPLTPEELVDMALAMPRRDLETVPESELPRVHPLRHMKLEEK